MTDVVADDVVTDLGSTASVSESLTEALYGPSIVFHEEAGLSLGSLFAEFIQELRPDRNAAPGLGLCREDSDAFVFPIHMLPLEDQQLTQAGPDTEVYCDLNCPLDVWGSSVMNLLEVFRCQRQLLGKLLGLLPFGEWVLREVLVLHTPVKHYFQIAEVAVTSCGRVLFVPAVDELDERRLF